MQGFPAWFGVPRKPTSTESEDCLLLDVIAPAEPVSSLLPVMVAIHGGGTLVLSLISAKLQQLRNIAGYTVGSSQPPANSSDILFALSSAPGNALVY